MEEGSRVLLVLQHHLTNSHQAAAECLILYLLKESVWEWSYTAFSLHSPYTSACRLLESHVCLASLLSLFQPVSVKVLISPRSIR